MNQILNRFFHKVGQLSFLVILSLGLGLRILYAVVMSEGLLSGDGEFYLDIANRILDNRPFSATWPPGIPYLLAGWMWLFGRSLIAVVACMLSIYLGFTIFLHQIVLRWRSKSAARVVSFAFAISPTFIHHSTAPLSHLPVAFCLLVLVYCAWFMPQNRRWLSTICSGVALGAAILIRPGTLFIIPVLTLVYIRLHESLYHQVVRTVGMIALAGIMIFVWEVQAYHLYDRIVWINDTSSSNLFIGNNADTPMYKTWWLGSHDESPNPEFQRFYATRDSIYSLPKVQQGPAFSHEVKAHIKDKPVTFAIRTLSRIRCFFAFDTFTGAAVSQTLPNPFLSGIFVLAADAMLYVFLGILFLLCLDHIKRTAKGRLMLLFALMYAAPYFLAFSHPTYHLPIVPLLAIMVARFWPEQSYPILSWPHIGRKLSIWIFLLIQVEWIWHMKSAVGL